MASAALIVGGLVAAIVSAIATLITTQVVSAAGQNSNTLFALLPTLFGLAAVMSVVIASVGVFL